MKDFFTQSAQTSQRLAVGIAMEKHRPCVVNISWQLARLMDTNTVRQKPK